MTEVLCLEDRGGEGGASERSLGSGQNGRRRKDASAVVVGCATSVVCGYRLCLRW